MYLCKLKVLLEKEKMLSGTRTQDLQLRTFSLEPISINLYSLWLPYILHWKQKRRNSWMNVKVKHPERWKVFIFDLVSGSAWDWSHLAHSLWQLHYIFSLFLKEAATSQVGKVYVSKLLQFVVIIQQYFLRLFSHWLESIALSAA